MSHTYFQISVGGWFFCGIFLAFLFWRLKRKKPEPRGYDVVEKKDPGP